MEKILIKFSGEIFNKKKESNNKISYNLQHIRNLVKQIKKLQRQYHIGIVVGGGNLFRGSIDGESLELSAPISHTIGMMATILNGLVFQEFLNKEGIKTLLLSAIECPQIAASIKDSIIEDSFKKNKCIIFAGGTGIPFFTTDTNAVARALQIGATTILKATKVDGIYTSDPMKNKNAKLIKKISYDKVLEKNLRILDTTAITLAKENNLKIKVFNVFKINSLINALNKKDFGSYIE